MTDPFQLSDELGDKLCDILRGEGELVSKWVAVAEIIDEDGRRYLRTFWPREATPWDNLGLLHCAMDDMDTVAWTSAAGEDDGDD